MYCVDCECALCTSEEEKLCTLQTVHSGHTPEFLDQESAEAEETFDGILRLTTR